VRRPTCPPGDRCDGSVGEVPGPFTPPGLARAAGRTTPTGTPGSRQATVKSPQMARSGCSIWAPAQWHCCQDTSTSPGPHSCPFPHRSGRATTQDTAPPPLRLEHPYGTIRYAPRPDSRLTQPGGPAARRGHARPGPAGPRSRWPARMPAGPAGRRRAVRGPHRTPLHRGQGIGERILGRGQPAPQVSQLPDRLAASPRPVCHPTIIASSPACRPIGRALRAPHTPGISSRLDVRGRQA